jgi:hypothetical protein
MNWEGDDVAYFKVTVMLNSLVLCSVTKQFGSMKILGICIREASSLDLTKTLTIRTKFFWFSTSLICKCEGNTSS